MSEQSLRAALEKVLATTDGWAVSNETLLGLLAAHPAEPAEPAEPAVDDLAARLRASVDAAKARRLAHPAESAPVVTDEAASAIYERLFHLGITMTEAKSALEAAAPLLGPRPLLDRDAATEALMAKWADLVERQVEDGTIGHCRSLADAVVPLARPMPTREQIEQAVSDAAAATGLAAYFKSGSLTDPSDLDEFIHAIEVLLNGAES